MEGPHSLFLRGLSRHNFAVRFTFPTDSRQITNRTMADAFEPPAAHCAGCQRTDVQLLICDDCVEPPAGMSREEMSKKR